MGGAEGEPRWHEPCADVSELAISPVHLGTVQDAIGGANAEVQTQDVGSLDSQLQQGH